MSFPVMQTDRREIYRYLGCGRADPGPTIRQQVERALELLQKTCTPHWIWASYPVTVRGNHTFAARLNLVSQNLAEHLQGCTQVCLFAATLGPAPDRLMQRAAASAVTPAAVLQAAAAAMTETFCDECCEKLASHFAKESLFLRPRYSPGYGDLDLSCQDRLLQILDAQKRIGLSCTRSLLLVPTKSVTAIVGVSPQPVKTGGKACDGKCAACSRTDCAYRLI
ncbi:MULTISPECIES: vitamin B12 dependent-methionine synthase activation domain-containing protein [Caproicibacterium]|nr:vitamin B12 dependent-methionine synthase activation domain-containing protein [Caproicibacterium lactatifermentans]ARP50089.1 hypothetical protein B6259_03870 [Ruminococcaceae bacterium CPB6]MDD4807931.1 vitamin B12 dependent-methionine synthase activation domain-containing protein [Oscillospiraceae bacterium]